MVYFPLDLNLRHFSETEDVMQWDFFLYLLNGGNPQDIKESDVLKATLSLSLAFTSKVLGRLEHVSKYAVL